MRQRIAAILLCLLALAPALAHPGTPTAHASTGPYNVYFPWVSQNEMLAGQGPWTTEFVIQNLSEVPCAAMIFVARPSGWAQLAQLSVQPRAARTIGAASVGVPQPGAPVRIQAACQLAVVAKQTTPRGSNPPWSDGAEVVTGYTGLDAVDVAASQVTPTSAWHLPIVQTNSGWNTHIRIANFSTTAPVDVTVELYPAGNQQGAGGATLISTHRLAVAESWTINARQALGVDGWVGYARITASGQVAAIAQRMKPSTQMAITNVAIAADSEAPAGVYQAHAPLLFTAYNGWNTGINLANVTDRTATLRLRYFQAGGNFLRDETVVIPPRGMTYIYTPGTVQQEGFVGGAHIISDAPVVGAIDEVKYETVEALSYMATAIGQRDAAIPVAFRHDPANGQHDNSGINIASFRQDANLVVRVTLFNGNGQPVGNTPIDIVVPPSGNTFLYLPTTVDLADGSVVSVRLRVIGDGTFAAISNDINYAVAGDGSVVFVASNSSGYFHVPNAASDQP
jgi:hypothetical protein